MDDRSPTGHRMVRLSELVDALLDDMPRGADAVTTPQVLAALERLGCERAGAMRVREISRVPQERGRLGMRWERLP